MLVIGEAVVEDALLAASFSCDLAVCKGACCFLEGGRGAPLADDEIHEIEAAFPVISRYLGPASLETISRRGLYEGTPGDYATRCIDNRECVFAYFQEGISRCSFERAYRAGEIGWPKPISCHLFPIRVRRESAGRGRPLLVYEQIGECSSGREKGSATGQSLLRFLREPLVRAYGEHWYKSLSSRIPGTPGHHEVSQ